jgi:hypothetical protein
MLTHKSFWLILIFISSSLALIIGVSASTMSNQKSSQINFINPYPAQVLTQETIQGDLKTRLLFSGDVFWGRRVQTWAESSPLKTAYPFSGLESFDKIQRESWIANLECPVTTSDLSQEIQEKQLRFNCQPQYLGEARKYFDIMGLANNHTDNMEEVGGLKQTRELLDKEGFQYFGHFDNDVEDDICEVVSVDMVTADNDKPTSYKLPVAICGYHSVFKLSTPDQIRKISEYSKYFVTVAFPHQGKEYISTPDQLQQSTYRAMIDSGADMVIGGHTHSIIGPEIYKNKLILYSTGNFIFDQQASDTVTKGVLIRSQIQMPITEYNNYKNLGDCSKFKDQCLQTAKANQIIKPQYQISYDMYASDNSNKLAKRASESVESAILTRLGWSQIQTKLNQE